MSRLTFILCIVSLFLCLSFVSAQESFESPRPLCSTPEVLRQVDEARQTIEKLPKEQKVEATFQLLSLLVRFDDKTAARQTIAKILELAPTIEKELSQQQLLEAIAYTQADIGDFTGALETIERIARISTRTNGRLTVVDKMLTSDLSEEEWTERATQAMPTLKKAVADAVEAKNAGLEAVARALLGRSLARQEKFDEAKAEFAAARKKAREIEAVEERNAVAMIVRSEIENGMVPEALALLESITDEEMKQGITGYAAVALLQNGKNNEADKLIESMAAGEYRDRVLMGIVRETAKTVTTAKIQELAGRLSTPDHKEPFLQQAVRALFDHDRIDAALDVAKLLKDPSQIQSEMRVRQLEKLLADEKFDEAQKFAEGFDDPQVKLAAVQYVLMARLKTEKLEDVQKQAEAFFSDADQQQIEQLRQETEKAAKIESAEERMAALTEIMRVQFGLFDLLGARKSMDLLLQTTESVDDPVTVIVYRLELAELQQRLEDRDGVKKNLGFLLQYLGEIKDLKTLEKLVEADREEENEEPSALAVKGAVDEEAIKNRVFAVYLTITNALGKAGDADGAQKTFEKAKQLAENDSNEMTKTEKMLLLSQLLAELKTP